MLMTSISIKTRLWNERAESSLLLLLPLFAAATGALVGVRVGLLLLIASGSSAPSSRTSTDPAVDFISLVCLSLFEATAAGRRGEDDEKVCGEDSPQSRPRRLPGTAQTDAPSRHFLVRRSAKPFTL